MKKEKIEKWKRVSEKRMIKYAKMWKKYNFYKRNKWLFYIPFFQIRYKEVTILWKHTFKDLHQELQFYKILQNQKI